jgi:hypothetical protein
MPKNNELVFAAYERDLLKISDWLDSEHFAYCTYRRGLRLFFVVDVRGDPGKAGRAYDIGYKISEIERNAIIKKTTN